MTVTPASLIAAYPEWVQANTDYPDMIIEAISIGTHSVDEAVVGDRFDEAVMLGAGAWLYDHPYSRDMRNPSTSPPNPYKEKLDEILSTKGSAWRTAWSAGPFSGWS